MIKAIILGSVMLWYYTYLSTNIQAAMNNLTSIEQQQQSVMATAAQLQARADAVTTR